MPVASRIATAVIATAENEGTELGVERLPVSGRDESEAEDREPARPRRRPPQHASRRS